MSMDTTTEHKTTATFKIRRGLLGTELWRWTSDRPGFSECVLRCTSREYAEERLVDYKADAEARGFVVVVES